MKARELYAIVKDLPREAWPSDVRWWDMGQQWNTIGECVVRPLPGCSGNTSVPISDDHAVLMFEASMARWLAENGRVHATTILANWKEGEGETRGDPNGKSGWLVNINGLDEPLSRRSERVTGDYWAPTLIEALSRACRAVGGKE